MISYDRDPQQTIPESSVKIIGLGGAGANMLDRAMLDGMTGPETLCLNTDMRTLSSSVAGEKIQIGKNLTKGLGAGGDPELGSKAAQESELEIRDSLRGRKMVFICVGLGGGTGSGAAPLITRFALEEGAFVVVLATMPFGFEGKRRREQAEESLNELAALSNALVTFDNNRMGELVLAQQGIHEAFAAADRMISESIKAVTRLVVRPGLINIGLDDLVTALSSNRSRCLFGSGIADGENRAQTAVENALASPLLDRGGLLGSVTSVLVHICSDETLTLYEVELLMQGLSKYIPASTQVLLGVSTDSTMKDSLSVTLISSLPEEKLFSADPERAVVVDEPLTQDDDEEQIDDFEPQADQVEAAPYPAMGAPEDEQIMEPSEGYAPDEEDEVNEPELSNDQKRPIDADFDAVPDFEEGEEADEGDEGDEGEVEPPFAETEISEDESEQIAELVPEKQSSFFANPFGKSAAGKSRGVAQGELELDGGPKGKFEGESPNVLEGEDLDIPPFLRKKRR